MSLKPAQTRGAPVIRTVGRVLRALPLLRGKRQVANVVGKLLVQSAAARPELARMVDGFRMHLDLGDRFQRQMFFSGIYEPEMARLLRRILRPGDVMIDGGANIGYFSLLASRYVGDVGVVHAFEPVPETFEKLAGNIALNGFPNIRANCLALADATRELQFEIPIDAESGAAVGWGATVARLGRGSMVTAPACALDDYVATAGISSIRLVKLDLEGGEPAALRGMHRLLSERLVTYLICEVNRFLLDALNVGHDTLRLSLLQHGYQCYRVSGSTGHLVSQGSPITPGVGGVLDYLFVAPGAIVPGGTRVARP